MFFADLSTVMFLSLGEGMKMFFFMANPSTYRYLFSILWSVMDFQFSHHILQEDTALARAKSSTHLCI